MFSQSGFLSTNLGELTYEVTERAGSGVPELPVYGVDRGNGLNRDPKYTAKDLKRYKRIHHGLFAYNPMRLNIGSIGYCSELYEPGLVSPDYVVFGCNTERLNPNFLKWYIKTALWSNWTRASGVGSVRVRIYYRELVKMPICIPSLEEQIAIASILDSLESSIDCNNKQNRTLEAMARALFQSWFVDFDPVKAKAAGKQPPGLKPEIAAMFPIAMRESELGPIPNGWETVPLNDLATITMGLSPDSKSYNGAGVGDPLINGPVEFGDFFPVKTKWTEAATRFAVEHDLVFCVRGSTTGRRVIADGKYAIGRGVCAIRAQHNRHCFLYQTIDFGLNRLLAKATGSVFPSLSAPDIKGFHILKPSSTLLDIYEKLAGPIINQVKVSHYECRLLSEIRNELLPKLVSGALRVAQVERILARVL